MFVTIGEGGDRDWDARGGSESISSSMMVHESGMMGYVEDRRMFCAWGRRIDGMSVEAGIGRRWFDMGDDELVLRGSPWCSIGHWGRLENFCEVWGFGF